MLSPSQLKAYLDHVKLSEANLQPSLTTLTTVHWHHMRWIPFANVTISRVPEELMKLGFPKETPDTSTAGIFRKLIDRKWYHVYNRRGGYCFESNSLLYKVLATLGFDVYCVAARNLIAPPHWKANRQEPCGFGHQLPLARVPESPDVWYVVDAAFGSPSPLGPVALKEEAGDELSGASHRVRRGFIGRLGTPTAEDLAKRPQSCSWYMQRHSKTEQEWQDRYVFNELNTALQPDYNMMNFWVSQSETSMFRKNLMISIKNDEGGHGRNTLIDTTLKVFDKEGDILQEKELGSAEELKAALAEYFGIVP